MGRCCIIARCVPPRAGRSCWAGAAPALAEAGFSPAAWARSTRAAGPRGGALCEELPRVGSRRRGSRGRARGRGSRGRGPRGRARRRGRGGGEEELGECRASSRVGRRPARGLGKERGGRGAVWRWGRRGALVSARAGQGPGAVAPERLASASSSLTTCPVGLPLGSAITILSRNGIEKMA